MQKESFTQGKGKVDILLPMSERLKQAIGDKSLRQFARECDISDSVLRRYVSGSSEPGVCIAKKMADAAGVSLDWLATGRESVASDAAETRPASQEASDDEFVYVNDYSLEVSAGHGAEASYELVTRRIAFRRDWIRQEGLEPSRLAVLWAKGDSMEPSIWDGDILLVDVLWHDNGSRIEFGTKDGLPPRDGIYIIRLDGHLVVKRIQLDMQGGFFVKSDNDAYKELHVTRQQLIADSQEPKPQITGRVVWFGRSI